MMPYPFEMCQGSYVRTYVRSCMQSVVLGLETPASEVTEWTVTITYVADTGRKRTLFHAL